MSQAPESRGWLLIADDDEFVQVGLTQLLERHRFQCVAVGTGEEALAKLRQQAFDALISDIHMPGKSGLELVELAATIAPRLPAVLLTGKPTIETAVRSVRLPVVAYLLKPPNTEELLNILDTAIAEYRGYRLMETGRARLQEWEREIAEIERRLRAPRGQAAVSPVGSYLRLTLRQVMLMLSDLERAAASLEQPGTAKKAALEEVEKDVALRRTVDVLERTKQNFKSKDLAELRKQLEQLLRRTTAVEERVSSARKD